MKQITDYDSFDFGFSTHSKDDYKDTRAEDMYRLIEPLLDNLAKDADKMPMINWPNRSSKIAEFKKRLQAILNS